MKRCPGCSSTLIAKVIPAASVLATAAANGQSPPAALKAGPLQVEVCPICSGIWFERGDAEAISVAHLSQFLRESKGRPVRPALYPCPDCGTPLKPLRSQNIPPTIRADYCPSCRGVFFSPTNFFKYKQAQLSKIAYFRNFHLPLSARSLLLTGLAGLLLLGTVTVGANIQGRFENRARAARLISRPFVTALAPDRATLTFTTAEKVRSAIVVKAPYMVRPRTLPIANTPTNFHQITLRDLRPATEYSYWLNIYDAANLRTTSAVFTLHTP